MDSDGFGKDAHIDIETVVEAFGRLQHQVFFVSDDIANIVGKTAVGKGNVGPALQNNDFRLFVQTAQAGSDRSAAGDTADNQGFHEKIAS